MIVTAMLSAMRDVLTWAVSGLPEWDVVLPDICGIVSQWIGPMRCYVDLDSMQAVAVTCVGLQVAVWSVQALVWVYERLPFVS